MNIDTTALMSKATNTVGIVAEFVSITTTDSISKASEVAPKVAKPVGEAAAYVFWAMSALVMLGFVVIVFVYDTDLTLIVGRIFGIISLTLMLSIGVMWICSKVLKGKF